jgi:hypothetical protein
MREMTEEGGKMSEGGGIREELNNRDVMDIELFKRESGSNSEQMEKNRGPLFLWRSQF